MWGTGTLATLTGTRLVEEPLVHVSNPVRFAIALVGAAALGWAVHTIAEDMGGSRVSEASTYARQASASVSDEAGASHSAKTGFNVTIVLSDPAGTAGGQGPDAQKDGEHGSAGLPAHGDSLGQRAPDSPGRQSTSTAPDPVWRPAYLAGPAQSPGLSIAANGDHIVIASDGSIVSVGDNTDLRGNTGDAAASGSIAIDVADSVLTSGDSGLAPTSGQPVWPHVTAQPPRREGTALPPQSLIQPPAPGGSVAGSLPGGAAGRAVGVAGYELHSIDVAGSDNLLTYDDSNLFFHRVGVLNGNTGDTDTSGLNVVDSTHSVVRSGDSGNSDETPDPPPFNPASLGASPMSGVLSTPTMSGSSVSIADVNGVSTATGADTLVIGGDGFDDNGVRVQGDRNVAIYDDGNVAIGGSGAVNAQIGDSDTSGAVVMAVRDSDIAAGDSFLPASQQAGAQVGDPFDGNDPDVSPSDVGAL
jgi:hypothetical protein